MFKSILRSTPIQKMLGFLIAAYMVIVKYTTRWEVRNFDKVKPIIDQGTGFIGLTWHGRFMMLNASWKRGWQNPHVLISRSRDGAIVAYATQYLGFGTLRGSSRKLTKKSDKGGTQAVRDMEAILKRGDCAVSYTHLTLPTIYSV